VSIARMEQEDARMAAQDPLAAIVANGGQASAPELPPDPGV
jgi:hypothetical protein